MESRKTAPKAKLIPNPKLRLQEQVREVMRWHHYSTRTEQTYWQWIKRFMVFHRKRAGGPITPDLSADEGKGVKPGGWRHPKDMGAEEVSAFLSHLTTVKDAARATQQQAFHPVR